MSSISVQPPCNPPCNARATPCVHKDRLDPCVRARLHAHKKWALGADEKLLE